MNGHYILFSVMFGQVCYYENHSDGEHFAILVILRVEKHWAKVKTSAIAYLFDRLRTFSNTNTPPLYEATTLHGVTTLQASLPVKAFNELHSFPINDSIALIITLNSRNGNSP